MKLNERITLFREKKSISKSELARMINVSPSYITKLENGEKTNPSLEIKTKIANALDISINILTSDEFFDREILNRAIYLTFKKQNIESSDVFIPISEYCDYDTILNFYNHVIEFLPFHCLKGLLYYIYTTDQGEYTEIYKDLIQTGIYDLDDKTFSICNDLYINTMNIEDYIDEDDKLFLKQNGYIENGKLINGVILDTVNRKIIQKNSTTFLPVSFDEMKSEVDKIFPALQPEVDFLSNPNIEMVFNYSYNELAKKGYDELLINAIEKAIRTTLEDIETHLNNGDLFDGVGSWISKDSPLYDVIKKHREEK